MAKNKRTKTQILRDRAMISELLLEGRGPTEIMLALNKRRPYNLSEGQIRYDIDVIEQEWIETKIRAFDKHRAIAIAKVEKLERTYWEAWNRSRRKKRKITKSESKSEGVGAEGDDFYQDSESRKEEVEGRVGDKDYLKGLQWCYEQYAKLTGAYKASKMEITWRERAKEYDLDPDKVVKDLQRQFVQAAKKGMKDDD